MGTLSLRKRAGFERGATASASHGQFSSDNERLRADIWGGEARTTADVDAADEAYVTRALSIKSHTRHCERSEAIHAFAESNISN